MSAAVTGNKPDYPPIRRLVTGHDGTVAKVLIDAPAGNAKYPSPGTVSTLIWSTDKTPASIPAGAGIEDMGARILGTAPPPNGTRFAVIDFPPGNAPHTIMFLFSKARSKWTWTIRRSK
jgi:hypothetical protein